jgi:hypothetical protein
MQRIDSEKLMDEVVRAIDGRRVREIVGDNPPFDNADYLWTKDDIVSEMKNLEKDFLSDPAISDRMHEMYNRWVDEGKDVPLMYGEGLLRTDQPPIECARELINIFKDKLESVVLRKANRQIRETKVNLNYPDAVGLLLLSNEGNFAFDPAMIAHVLFHALGSKFSSIEHVIFFSANLRVPTASSTPAPLFASIRFPNRRPPSSKFLTRLGSRWFETLSAATGEKFPPFAFGESSSAEIDALRFRPRI